MHWLFVIRSSIVASIDASKSEPGKAIFERECAACHQSERTGTRTALQGIDTDPERMWTWNKENAQAANRTVSEFGIQRKGLVEADLIGYNIPFLDGLWLRAPYLHNGSVPTLRDLLSPPESRPKKFWRGYDVYDPIGVGFISAGLAAEQVGSMFDTTLRANSNSGHVFGTTLPDTEKEALLEYLKTL